MFDSPLARAFRSLLNDHHIESPSFAHGQRAFNPDKPSLLYSGPYYDQDEMVAVMSAMVEGKWSVAGEYVNRFEREFGAYIKQKHSTMVNSGSSADLLMVAAAKERLGWKDGDGIIVSPAGFPTTISAITLNGLTPIFVDIEMETLNADSDQTERLLNHWAHQGHIVRAIMVSPVLGNPPDMDRLTDLAMRFGVTLLLDGCDSLGSLWRGKHLAEYALASSCSFYPAHHISTIGGGMISSNDEGLIKLTNSMASWGKACWCRSAGNLLPNGTCGRRFSPWLDSTNITVDHRYVYSTDQAYNLLPLDLQGALGLVQMRKLSEIHTRRAVARQKVWSALSRIPQVRTASVLPHANPSWFGVPIICPDSAFKTKLVSHLESHGIQTRNYFAGNILMHEGYKHLGEWRVYPNASSVLSTIFFIGCAPFYDAPHFTYLDTIITKWLSLDKVGQDG